MVHLVMDRALESYFYFLFIYLFIFFLGGGGGGGSIWRVKTYPGEYNLNVTRPEGEC